MALTLWANCALLPAIAQQPPPAPTEEQEAQEAAKAAEAEEAPPPPKIDVKPEAEDPQIADRLERILNATDWYERIDVQVRDGVVFLDGVSQTKTQKEWATKLASSTQDVAAVVNRIEVARPSTWDFSPAWEQLSEMGRLTVQSLPAVAFSILVLILTWALVRGATRGTRSIAARRVQNPLLVELIVKLAATPVILLGLYFALRVSNLTGLAATVLGGTGLIGLVIGIAFRDIAENFLASILVSMQRPYRAGDLIAVADQQGFVQKVTTRGTLLITLEGNHVQIPNATIYKSVIRNFSANPSVRLDFVAAMRYDRNASEGQDVILQALQEHEAVLADPEPLVLVEELAWPVVKLHAYFWINSRKNSTLKVRSALVRLAQNALEAAGLSPVPAPSSTPAPPTIVPYGAAKAAAPVRPSAKPAGPDSTAAEGDLQSESKDIRKQAKASRDLEPESNLLEAR
jgi:small conductance mechanosensitive channel